MSQTLALKWRPRRFADIVGNVFATRVLCNSIIQKKIKSAYFFAGGKGSGKTSTARIFARAINCTNRPELSPEPCGACGSCIEIDREVLMGDVMEIDAASQNSVASIRTLIGQVEYAPASGSKRVIILDEVHMLSQAASNALLKTLEEPPEHAVFIFCTTDPQRVLDTIRSRALYFEFARLTVDDIAGRLQFVAGQEGVLLDPQAAEIVGQSVNGALRDALTILDQASILDSHVTAEIVAQIIGYVAPGDLYALFAAIHAGKDTEVQAWLDTMTDKLDQDVLTSILHFLETLLLLNVGADVTRRLPPDLAGQTKKLAAAFTMQQLFAMGELTKSTLLDYRRLNLRDSRVLLRLLLLGLLLVKENKQSVLAEQRVSIFELAQTGRRIELDLRDRLRQVLNAEEVELQDVPSSSPSAG